MSLDKFQNRISLIKIVIGITILIVIGAYILNFGSVRFSKDPSVWGTLGDYIGGLLNPIFTIINIVITYYIAEMVNEFSKGQNSKQELVQIKIIKSQLRFDALKEFKNEINSILGKINDANVEQNQSLVEHFVNEGITSVESFKLNYGHLFNEQPNFEVLTVLGLKSIISAIRDHKMIMSIPNHKPKLSLDAKIKSTIRSKDSMIAYLGSQIIRKLEKNATLPSEG